MTNYSVQVTPPNTPPDLNRMWGVIVVVLWLCPAGTGTTGSLTLAVVPLTLIYRCTWANCIEEEKVVGAEALRSTHHLWRSEAEPQP